tara:strand:- start:2450 stop:2689 length:240 start_codon:yes stop_codon:yes gene_type:complete
LGFKMGHKQSKKLLKTTKVPLGLAGASIGMGIAGQAFGSTALQGAGATAGAFIAPAVSISMGGYVVNELRDLKGVKKKK